MDLHLVSTNVNKSLNDEGYGEFSKAVSEPKFFRDKRKIVVSSKAILNQIITKNPTKAQKINIPFIVVMGFEMHLCCLFLLEKQFYVSKILKTVTFPSTTTTTKIRSNITKVVWDKVKKKLESHFDPETGRGIYGREPEDGLINNYNPYLLKLTKVAMDIQINKGDRLVTYLAKYMTKMDDEKSVTYYRR